MLATIVGRLPGAAAAADPDAALRDGLGIQLAAGLGLLATGRCDDPLAVAPEAIAATWRTAQAHVRALAADAGADAGPVRHAILGPCSAGDGGGATARSVAAVRSALAALAAAGAAIVELTEPWLGSLEAGTDAGRARALDAWAAALEGCPLHVLLVAPGAALEPFGAPALAAAPFSSCYLDLIAHPDDWRVAARLPGERGLVLGVGDPRPGRTLEPAVLVWAAGYAASMRGRGPDRVVLAPAAGLEEMTPDGAAALLAGLADAAQVAGLPARARAAAVDPRLVSARSAALGAAVPPPRRRRPADGEGSR